MASFFTTPHLRTATVNMYDSYLHRWLHLIPFIEVIILLPKQSIKILMRHLLLRQRTEHKHGLTHTNICHFIGAVLAVLRYSHHVAPTLPDRDRHYRIWMDLQTHCKEKYNNRRLLLMPTEKQAARGGAALTFQDLIHARDSGRLNTQQTLLLSMYTHLYPVRADYYATQIVHGNETPIAPNYIRIHSHNHAELMLTNFKTATEYKQIHYPTIPIPLLRIILQSLQQSPRTYLFESARHTPLTRNRYSQMASHTLQQIFGVPLNLTMIRHIFISTLSMDTPLNELKKIGELMGHSLTQQRLYQWKHLHNQKDDDDDPTIARTIS